ncbi:MAG TPA: sugar ABC transporter permease [Solidesulfovibrio magneticus]|nr:sugar ABC transporter permease [Solidesulfovibrio magneticus]
MTRLIEIIGGNTRQLGMLFALIALILFFQVRTDGLLLTPANVMNLLNGNAYILVLSIGMALVIIAGHIDLSVGSVAAFAGIVSALAMRDWGLSSSGTVLLCLGIGALIGAWQGFWVAYVGIPAFVVTLAGMMLFRGANQIVGKSNTIPVPEAIQYIGGGYLPALGPDTGYSNLTLLLGLGTIIWLALDALRTWQASRRLSGDVPPHRWTLVRSTLLCAAIVYLTLLFASGRSGTSFPVPGLILACLTILYTFIAKRTILGRHVYAVGGNKQAAQLSGVNVRFVTFLVMMNMSVLAALAGLMFVGRATASGPFDGVNWELDAISAVFIGGAAVSGGVGTVVGSVVGGLVMAVLNNGLQLLGIGADMTQVLKGFVLLVAVAFDVYNKCQGKPSLIAGLFRKLASSDAKSQIGEEPAATGTAQRDRWPVVGRYAAGFTVLALCAALGVWLGGPGSDRKASDEHPVAGASSGFAQGTIIGVALPQKTSENWVLAERLFKEGLSKAGYRPVVQFANGGVPEQQNQIQSMIAQGAKVLIIGAIDGSQLGAQVREAKKAGAVVIAYDRLLKNTDAVDYYVAYDSFKVGELQGKALLEGLKKFKGRPPWTIELIAGSPDDANSQVFYEGAMSVLKPLMDAGTLVVKSKQTTFAQAATPGWKAENAHKRMDTILAGVYSQENLDGILSPNDTLARAAMTSIRSAGKDLPVVTGQDSEVESVKSIMRGEQFSTINKDTAALVGQVIAMVNDLHQGKAPRVNTTECCNNGVKSVPAFLLEPRIVTLENIREAYAQDPVLKHVVSD